MRKYIIEFILVFFSVVGAFFFEDWRVKREEDSNYLNILRQFQYDLKEDMSIFQSEIDSTHEQGSGRRLRDRERLARILQSYEEGNQNEALILNVMYFGLIGSTWDPRRSQSEQYNQIVDNHYFRIRLDAFKSTIKEYDKLFKFRNDVLDLERQRFQEIRDEVYRDFEIHHDLPDLFEFYGSNFKIKPINSYSSDEAYLPILTKNNLTRFSTKSHYYYNKIKRLLLTTNGIIFIHQASLDGPISELDSLITEELKQW